ncbi:MAG TPA: translation initiation factor IF-2 subunit beta [Candidatus Bathyarchaeia archaeon]|nr:translation initiation factor IF-2 subunit beta [Candidatus Bathyarchaeia archaeon]
MQSDYRELLKRAHSQLPREIFEHKRFEVPRVRSGNIGMRTYIVNFREIAEAMNRDPLHLLRYLSREMATAGSMDSARAIFHGKFKNDSLESLVQHYAQAYLICPVCKRPDTKIVKEKRFSFLACEACGAKSSVRTI